MRNVAPITPDPVTGSSGSEQQGAPPPPPALPVGLPRVAQRISGPVERAVWVLTGRHHLEVHRARPDGRPLPVVTRDPAPESRSEPSARRKEPRCPPGGRRRLKPGVSS